jgi:AraC-like DNA-binding protein
MPEPLIETHVHGDHTEFSVVRAHDQDKRDWLKGAPVCQALSAHQIVHAGVLTARAPYKIVRQHQGGVYFLACIGGEGRVLVDGRWQKCGAGMAVALPAFMANAFQAVPGKDWHCVWVRYEQARAQKPLLTSSSPVMAGFDGLPLYRAVQGLIAEAAGAAMPAAIFHWVELVQMNVARFVQPWQEDERLWRIWERVAKQVGRDWTLQELADAAHVSPEHLRRLCRKALGRSPMQHVIWLRMRKAAELLATTDAKIESVSRTVGYQNPFVFSNTFKKWIGWRPSEHRGRTLPARQG